jgi:hypothetical protein
MKVLWVVFATISFAAAAVWLFAAGWAGRVPWLPDMQLLHSGEWLLWLAMFILLYGPIAFGAWALLKAIRAED